MYKLKNHILLVLVFVLVGAQVKSQEISTNRNTASCYSKECHDNLYFKVSAHSGKNYTKLKVIEYPNGNSRQNSTTNNDPRNRPAGIDWLRRGKRYEIAVYGRNKTWLPWSYRCSYIEYVPEGVSGTISSNKDTYCEDEPISITYNLNNNSSIGFLIVRKNGNNVFTTTQFSYNSSINLKQVLSTPNNYGNTYNLTSGNYSIIFRVNEPGSACGKDFTVNFEIKNNSLKEPLVTFNYKDTSLVGTYTIHNICNSRNNDGVLLRINRDITLNVCERIDEKISITISEFNTLTGASTNTQSIVYNFPYANLTFIKLKDIFPTYSFRNNTNYKMVVSGQAYYFKMKSWGDCFSVSNPILSPRINSNLRIN